MKIHRMNIFDNKCFAWIVNSSSSNTSYAARLVSVDKGIYHCLISCWLSQKNGEIFEVEPRLRKVLHQTHTVNHMLNLLTACAFKVCLERHWKIYLATERSEEPLEHDVL